MKEIIEKNDALGIYLIEMTLDGTHFNYIVKLPLPFQDKVFSNNGKGEAYHYYNEMLLKLSKS